MVSRAKNFFDAKLDMKVGHHKEPGWLLFETRTYHSEVQRRSRCRGKLGAKMFSLARAKINQQKVMSCTWRQKMDLQSDRSLKQKRRQSKTLKQKSDARQTKRFLNWPDGLSTIG